MLKALARAAVRRLRNPGFEFDPAVTSSAVASLILDGVLSLLRGFVATLLRGRPRLNLFLGRGVGFRLMGNMRIGRSVRIGDYAYLGALGRGRLELGNNVNVGAFSRLIVSISFNNIGEHIRLGDHVGLGEFASIGGGGGTEIGEGTIIGQYFSTHPENHNFSDPDVPIRLQGVTRKGIKIGRNCWIGSKVTVLDGVEVGDDCVIAAGAVLTKSFPAGVVIGGVPARVLKPRNRNEDDPGHRL